MRQFKNSTRNKSPSKKGMPTIQEVLQIQEDAPAWVEQLWQDQGCLYDPVTSLWVTPAGQTCRSDELALWVIEFVHFATHCGANAVSDMLLETWWHPKLLTCPNASASNVWFASSIIQVKACPVNQLRLLYHLRPFKWTTLSWNDFSVISMFL